MVASAFITPPNHSPAAHPFTPSGYPKRVGCAEERQATQKILKKLIKTVSGGKKIN
jgi:hypothetical protein